MPLLRSKPAGERPRERSAEGFTTIELMVALVVLMVALAGLSTTVVSVQRLNRQGEERSAAANAARRALESLAATPFHELFATFNGDPNDDPAGAGSAPGADFAVGELSPRRDDADGLVGSFVFPTAVGPVGALELREDVVDASLGLPRDLDGDGLVGAADVSDTYVALPVTVRVEWTGASGDQFFELDVLLVR